MPADERDQVKTIFGAALSLRPEERTAFIRAACGSDEALLAALLDLLENHCESAGTSNDVNAKRVPPVFTSGDLVAERFRIVRLVARGGMGEVYEVWDERLRLTLALKTLRADLALNKEALERFQREVLLARDVTHDNICRVYDLVEHHTGKAVTGDEEIIPCLTMEYIVGETLADLLARSRPLDPEQSLRIAEGSAAGLQILHDRGIIHRDLKPSNVMLTKRRDGTVRPVVMDFGLARACDRDRNVFETQLEVQAGSPYFMAPEVLRGSSPSVASDIYSYGLLLDEMVTQTRAFPSQSAAALFFSKLCEPVPKPTERANGLDLFWEAAILSCLDPDPLRRPGSATEVIEALRSHRVSVQLAPSSVSETAAQSVAQPEARNTAQLLIRRRWKRVVLSTGTLVLVAVATVSAGFAVKPNITTVAVFDVENEADPRYDYLARGTTSEIIRRLTQIQGVRVLPQYTTRRKADPQQKQIRFAMEGMLQAYKNDVQLFMQVTDNEKGEMAWTERYDSGVRDNPLKVQEQIAREATAAVRERIVFDDLPNKPLVPIARLLRGNWLFAPPWQRQPAGPTISALAFDRYLRARYLLAEVTPEGHRQAAELLESAVTEDPTFALAWATLATTYIAATDFHEVRQSDLIAKAQHAAEKAVRADQDLPEAYMAYAATRELSLDWSAAEASYQRALELKPTFSWARRWYANMMLERGRFEEAIAAARRAAEDDPYDRVSGPTGLGWILFVSGREEEAMRVLLAATQGRDAVGARLNLAQVYGRIAQRSRGSERQDYFNRAVHESETVAGILARTQDVRHGEGAARVSDQMFALVYSMAGDHRKAQPHLQRLESAMAQGRISPAILGWVYALQGRQEDAIAALKSAAQSPDRKSLYTKVMPYLQTLQGNPNYEALLKDMRF